MESESGIVGVVLGGVGGRGEGEGRGLREARVTQLPVAGIMQAFDIRLVVGSLCPYHLP